MTTVSGLVSNKRELVWARGHLLLVAFIWLTVGRVNAKEPLVIAERQAPLAVSETVRGPMRAAKPSEAQLLQQVSATIFPGFYQTFTTTMTGISTVSVDVWSAEFPSGWSPPAGITHFTTQALGPVVCCGAPTISHRVEVASNVAPGTYQFAVEYVWRTALGTYVGLEWVSFTITVVNQNTAPTLGSVGSRTVNEGQNLTVQLSASDPDGDPLTYSATINPSGPVSSGTVSLSGNIFSFTPSFSEAGSYTVAFTVSDGNGGEDSETITVTVNNVNQAPSLSSIGNQSVAEGQTLSLSLTGSDPDGDPLTYSATINPSGPVSSGTVS
ncbi:MAG: cadherin-like domain-containing protein, partial [Candidatus Latescibacteria bacterium]|nr:cadherin-like domain-containing protein [Candidatus Latescibacterota bacterium]